MMKKNNQHTQKQMEALIQSIDHKTCITWAALCANHVLFYYTSSFPNDQRPNEAILAAHQFVADGISLSEAKSKSLLAHEAARSSSNPSATFAARSAAHAAATPSNKSFAIHTAKYAIKAVAATKDTTLMLEELKWQLETLTNLKNNTQ
ncbi:MAG: hypothetical protein NUK62_07830 [Tenericutes bacterium]|nr:hypothetical protein [Mycoplasmatota bacterium]